ncbi:hypothetical protein [Bifidobacterium choloepi]|uniref:Uncharacterized protein n=1 Tax=Bifidobacterium choloepi TaxID=2614131 RepID=A0A6I5N0B4_9BIFI|nr:hypothetical protein [Bifidobacterium choloepi]NEG69565.1 hypothetical protein [Bifidobacterium choloepi]
MTEVNEEADVTVAGDAAAGAEPVAASGDDIEAFIDDCVTKAVDEALDPAKTDELLASTRLGDELSADRLDSQTYFNLRMWEEQTGSGEAFAAYLEDAERQMALVRNNTAAFTPARREDVLAVARTKVETDAGLRKLRNPEVVEQYREPPFLAVVLSIVSVALFLGALLSFFSMVTELVQRDGLWLTSLVRIVGFVAGGIVCCVPRFIYTHRKKQWDTWHLSDQARRNLIVEHVRDVARQTVDEMPGAFAWGNAVWRSGGDGNDSRDDRPVWGAVEHGDVVDEESLTAYARSLTLAVRDAPTTLPSPDQLPRLASIELASPSSFPRGAETMREALATLKTE